jgi:hypothetical protein
LTYLVVALKRVDIDNNKKKKRKRRKRKKRKKKDGELGWALQISPIELQDSLVELKKISLTKLHGSSIHLGCT